MNLVSRRCVPSLYSANFSAGCLLSLTQTSNSAKRPTWRYAPSSDEFSTMHMLINVCIRFLISIKFRISNFNRIYFCYTLSRLKKLLLFYYMQCVTFLEKWDTMKKWIFFFHIKRFHAKARESVSVFFCLKFFRFH